MIKLRRGQLLPMRESIGQTITAHAGAVWITEQDNPRDVLLRAGESFEITRSGLALLEAFTDATVSFQ